MSLADRLRGVARVFLDTAPFIYFAELNPNFIHEVDALFTRLEDGSLAGVTSPITLAEALVIPLRRSNQSAALRVRRAVTAGKGIEFVGLNDTIAASAADIRARHGFHLLDSVQLATAIASQCEAFVTNDFQLRRMTEIQVVTVSE